MDDTELVLLGLVLGIGVIVFLASLLDRRTKSKGTLFSGTPTRSQRLLAFLIGVLLTGVVISRYALDGSIYVVIGLCAVACFAYSFGVFGLLQAINRPRK